MVKVVSTARRADAVRCIGCGINGKDDPLIQGYGPCHVTNLTNLVQLIAKELQHSTIGKIKQIDFVTLRGDHSI